MLDWPAVLAAHRVHYVTRGRNVSKGYIAVRCPFCGSADPSEHMTISLKGSSWRCWRNPRQHSGTSLIRLLKALLHCSEDEARRLAGEREVMPLPMPDQEFAQRAALLRGQEIRVQPTSVQLPPEIKPLSKGSISVAFWDYLRDRDFTDSESEWLVSKYKLHYAIRGEYRYRLIVPVYSPTGALWTWTARTILYDEPVRYKSLHKNESVRPPNSCLLGLPLLHDCRNPEVLVLCEGSFDAMRITVLGHKRGVYGTCLFGLHVNDLQFDLLEDLRPRFRKIVLLLDEDAYLKGFPIWDRLSRLRVLRGRLPEGTKDPGDLQRHAAGSLMGGWL